VPLRDLALINERIQENKFLVLSAVFEVGADKTNASQSNEIITKVNSDVEINIATITNLWNAYQSTFMTDEEKALAGRFTESRSKFVKEGLQPAVAALTTGRFEDAKKQVAVINDLYKTVDTDLEVLKNFQADVAAKEYQNGVQRFQSQQITAFSLLGVSIAVLIWLGFSVSRSITRPLTKAINAFGNISNGDFSTMIDADGRDEISQVLLSLKAMQTKLGFDVAEAKRIADENQRIKLALDGAAAAVMIADNDRNIIYTNKSVIHVLGEAEADVRKVLPNFNVNN
jgi:methyl-accepting chemotaxis protein